MNDLLVEFKERMHISHNSEDDNLIRILKASESYMKSKGIDVSEGNEQAKELTIERSRYVYNDAVEFFEDNFLSQILSLSFDNYKEGDAIE